MGVNFNEAQAKKGGGGMLSPGVYTAYITDVMAVLANSGTRGIGVVFEVADGPELGAKINDTVWVTPKTIPYAKYNLEAAGAQFPPGEIEIADDDPGFKSLARSIMGKRVSITVGMEPDRNDSTKSWPRVKGWEKVDGAPAAGGGGTGAAATNDDIPF